MSSFCSALSLRSHWLLEHVASQWLRKWEVSSFILYWAIFSDHKRREALPKPELFRLIIVYFRVHLLIIISNSLIFNFLWIFIFLYWKGALSMTNVCNVSLSRTECLYVSNRLRMSIVASTAQFIIHLLTANMQRSLKTLSSTGLNPIPVSFFTQVNYHKSHSIKLFKVVGTTTS